MAQVPSPPLAVQRGLAVAALAAREPSPSHPTQESGSRASRVPARKKVAQKSFAQALRDIVTPEEHARWLLLFSQGVDPDAKPGVPTAVIDARLRYQARVTMIEFAYGTAPQRIQVEAEIRASLAPAVDVDLGQLTDAELQTFRDLRRKALRAPTRAIDAESVDVPPADAGGEDAP